MTDALGETTDRLRTGRAGAALATGHEVRRRMAFQRQETADGLLWTALDTVTTPVAVLDRHGRILLANASWGDFLRASDHALEDDGVGADYLQTGILPLHGSRDAASMRIGLRKVLRGVATDFKETICVRQVTGDHWYQISAARFQIGTSVRIVVTHEDTTAVHSAQETVDCLSRQLLTLQDEERQRIAVELHDSTTQQLTAAGLYLSSLRQKSPRDPETLQIIEQIERTIDEAQKEIRTFSYLLHPPYLDRDGLRSTLTRFIDGYARRTSLRATLRIPREVDCFAPPVQLALLRIVQEALSNVHRHASATVVRVRMKTTRTMFLFDISDNGRGLGGSQDHPAGLGLPGMHERIHRLGGALKILSGERGTCIVGKVPLAQCRHGETAHGTPLI
jgi:signal transduction histidine kinase